MTLDKLNSAIEEADRFLRRARQCRDVEEKSTVRFADTMSVPTSMTAAVRRSSMDLSQALTDLRKFPSRRKK